MRGLRIGAGLLTWQDEHDHARRVSPPAFDVAWLHHSRRNKHHWQYWAQVSPNSVTVTPMPDRYRREMLADWIGAGTAQGKPDTKAWYLANRDKMILHAETTAWIERHLNLTPLETAQP